MSIVSPPIPINESTSGHCLTIHTYTGRDILFPEAVGSIKVFQQFGKYEKRPIMEIFGSDAHKWIERNVTIPASIRENRVLLQAIFGRSYYSDMAVDDLVLTHGPCGGRQPGKAMIISYSA